MTSALHSWLPGLPQSARHSTRPAVRRGHLSTKTLRPPFPGLSRPFLRAPSPHPQHAARLEREASRGSLAANAARLGSLSLVRSGPMQLMEVGYEKGAGEGQTGC